MTKTIQESIFQLQLQKDNNNKQRKLIKKIFLIVCFLSRRLAKAHKNKH